MAYEKLYNEIYAIVALKYLWKGYRQGYVKCESPDWVNPVESTGIEVSQALLPYDGQAASFLEAWLGKLSGEIPGEYKARYAERMYFYNDRLWALLPDERDVRGWMEKSLYRFSRKLEKLNKNFALYKTNLLYLYAHTAEESMEEVRQLLEQMLDVQRGAGQRFDIVFLDCESGIYALDLRTGSILRMPVGEKAKEFLERQTEQIRNDANAMKKLEF